MEFDEGIYIDLRTLLDRAVRRNLSDGILLSGGLDTSISAFIASKYASLRAFTVAFEGAPASDIEYAKLVASRLGLEHYIHYFDEDELFQAIVAVVRIMSSFDPMEIRNDVPIFIALKTAKGNGTSSVMTGDGCDELFAGYSFLFKMEKEQLDLHLEKLWDTMTFSAIPLAKSLGIEAKLPFLDPEVRDFAIKLDSRHKVKRVGRHVWGKWILRKTFEGILPDEIVWRVKTPIECGSGTSILPSFFNLRISDEEFEEKRRKYLHRDRVTIRDKEQLYYYEVYRSVIGVPHPSNLKGKICPQCNSNVHNEASYCRTCGAYPI